MIRLPLSQLGKWDRGQKDMKRSEREREASTVEMGEEEQRTRKEERDT